MPDPKPIELRQGHPSKPTTVIQTRPDKDIDKPSSQANWLPYPTCEMWDDFWNSEMAPSITAELIPVVVRLFEYRDQQFRYMDAFRKKPLTTGSTGTSMVNPLWTIISKLETQILHLEDRLGLSPRARIALGLAIGQQKLTLLELNRVADTNAMVTEVNEDEW